MIAVSEWTRLHRSMLSGWRTDDSVLSPAFLLRAPFEPYQVQPISLALSLDGLLLGRFTYRWQYSNDAFVGLVLAPSVRGRRLSVPCMVAALTWLAWSGITTASASVAVANVASYKMLFASGFSPIPEPCYDWRSLPSDFDVSLLSSCLAGSYVLEPAPAMLYVRLAMSIDVYLSSAEVA